MLNQSCESLPGVGPVLAEKLTKCGIKTLRDLLFHLPLRYQDRTRITPIQDLRANEWCVVAGRVCKTEIKFGRKRMLYCFIEDKTGILKLRFFHFNKQQQEKLKNNASVRAFGEVRMFANTPEMIHPEYIILDDDKACEVEETLTPIYPSTLGLNQTKIRQLVKHILTFYKQELSALEWMQEEELHTHSFLPFSQAIENIHNPAPDTSISSLEEGVHPAIKRIIFDELLAQRVSIQLARFQRGMQKSPILPSNVELQHRFLHLLPFPLTNAQKRVQEEISKDLIQDKPMLRLVQGDVGAGKTVVAALAAVQAIASGYQVALMAPTDLLSEQHFNTLSHWLNPLGISVLRLSGKMKTVQKREVLQAVAQNKTKLIVGTHALFQDKVVFAQLGLVIIDEQHRFGVEQRLSLQQKGQENNTTPHQLLMTATPIPRTLAMTHYAHLDLSILDELPPGRSPVVTAIINQDKRELIITRLREAINEGRQAYWVCTLIEDSEKLQCMAAVATYENLQEQLPKARIGLIHGRMKPQEKEEIMIAFKDGTLDLLVATTVIEVGVDVPNASLMIIENAERLGLSQLHQLRGRVGRGKQQAHCLLLYQNPLSSIGAERLRIMRSTNDGFVVAEKDLQLRGAGEMLGIRQTGYKEFKIAKLPRDSEILHSLAPIANRLLHEKPEIARSIAERWLGNYEHYLQI
ncbi:ATP-dependent DNA helicase RecG (plasmid) [Legionella adelaidensis]|uniref:ATP-dependent DNA helicase RecG n=1 Tax=Legionella adelaidensis TaxID=45056 RepID=A0A0W0R662_9GAMM|nr:ATP-dependent DNA helicase RecG [Legionella adelaidensis]KTC66505.1 ATP-dependent DNA helicase RecG [Legionella adelaidensis]VEH85798.1 ATP-dependent DNA helicase RecG [Legionella adelaidensis]